MAAIDKIYVKKSEAGDIIDWLESVLPRAQETFPNFKGWPIRIPKSELEEIEDDPDIPILLLPELLDRWLYQQPDCPQSIKTCLLEFNYGGNESALLQEIPLTRPPHPPIKPKIISRPRFSFPLKGYYIVEAADQWIWFRESETGKMLCTELGDDTAEDIGVYPWMATSVHVKCGSPRSLLRRVKKWIIPPGTVLRVTDRGGDTWKIKIEKDDR